MRNLIKPIYGVGISVFAALVLAVQPAFALSAETVRPADIRPIGEVATGPAGWYRTVTGSGYVDATDAKPYNVAGSLEFSVADSGSYAEAALYKKLPSHRLSELASNGLSYATWQTTDSQQAVSLQIGLDLDVTDSDTAWQGRLVYEPYMNTDFYGDTVAKDKWQTWLTTKQDAQWWMTWSAAATASYGPNPCPQSAPCTYSQILQLFPDAGFNSAYANPLVLKAGSGWSSFLGYADVPYVGSTTDMFWDFEPALATPTAKDQCKNEGWSMLVSNDGQPFKNQGQCVSSVAASGRAVR